MWLCWSQNLAMSFLIVSELQKISGTVAYDTEHYVILNTLQGNFMMYIPTMINTIDDKSKFSTKALMCKSQSILFTVKQVT